MDERNAAEWHPVQRWIRVLLLVMVLPVRLIHRGEGTNNPFPFPGAYDFDRVYSTDLAVLLLNGEHGSTSNGLTPPTIQNIIVHLELA